MSKNISKKEKALMKRAKELAPTDRYAAGALSIPGANKVNASRLIMANHQFTHMVSIKDPEQPLVLTGFENVLAEFNDMLNPADRNYKVVKKFEKNIFNYVLIVFDDKTKTWHAYKRQELEEHSEGFATRYNNTFMDSLDIGDNIDKGEYVQKSTNYDKHMNYMYGKNLNTVYMVAPYIYEDGILAMNGADEMMNTFRCHTIEINLADNDVLINWFGDNDHYQGIPLVGEKTRKGFVAIVRKIQNSKAAYSLKKKKLRHKERDDIAYYAEGRVIDISINTNKEFDKMPQAGAMKIINDLYKEQQQYYRDLYKYMQNIIDTADDRGETFTDEFTIICANAKKYVDSSAFLTDSNDNVFGNTKIVIKLMEEEKIRVGTKLVGRYGNKGVISKILKPEESWVMEDGTPIHLVVAALGIVGRLNQFQMNEHSINEMGATIVKRMKEESDVDKKLKMVHNLMTYLNSDEASAFKSWVKNLSDKEKAKFAKRIERDGITIIQEPIDNVNMMDIGEAYKHIPPNYQHIVYPDGTLSMRKVLCAKAFFFRLKQDPLEKYAARSRGPINPLNNLPAKSNQKKNYIAPFSDVAVRFGEMELEVLLAMCPHPKAISDFMMENSTSWDAKLALSEQNYMCDPDSDIDTDDIIIKGKKNTEWIGAYTNVLGTDIVIDIETAPEGEYFLD